MEFLRQFHLLFRVPSSYAIARRYFVVNGFDGALTMLGIIMGFYFSGEASISITISACFGAAIALGMSGFSSAYISESAERQQELKELEAAMVTNLSESAYGRAARLIPMMIAFINGIAPLMIALMIISPLWLASTLEALLIEPLLAAIGVAFGIIFLLGVLLGKVSGTFWLLSGLRAMLIGIVTCIAIFLLTSQ
jgi:predicted membrane protein (TIGR00267 family)